MVDADSTDPVPPHLRDAHYAGAAKLGHGEGLRVPHDFEGAPRGAGVSAGAVRRGMYYEPSGQGEDVEVEPGTGAPTRGRPRTEASPMPWVCWGDAHPPMEQTGGNG